VPFTSNVLCLGMIPDGAHKQNWKAPAPLKCKVFAWLVLRYILWTSDRRFHHGLQNTHSAYFTCLQKEDKVDHIYDVHTLAWYGSAAFKRWGFIYRSCSLKIIWRSGEAPREVRFSSPIEGSLMPLSSWLHVLETKCVSFWKRSATVEYRKNTLRSRCLSFLCSLKYKLLE
jgi:hypothetical protein